MNAMQTGRTQPAQTLLKGKQIMRNPFVNRRDERGQILVIVAGGLLVFIGFVGLVIDTGVGFRERRNDQNASDLSAMAGTKVIADHYLDGGRTGSEVYAAVNSSLLANGCIVADGCSWTAKYVKPDQNVLGGEIQLVDVTTGSAIPADAQGVRVDTASSPATFFMGVFGIDEINVKADATAMTSSLFGEAPAGVLLPIGAFDSDYEPGVEYELTAGEEGPGNFGWLSWSGDVNEGTLSSSLCNPDNPAIEFPVWIEGSTGTKNSRGVRDCMDGWLGTTVLIPIWGQSNDAGGSRFDFEIITLGAFVLTDYNLQANTVNGYFVEFYALPGVPAGYGSPPCPPTDDSCSTRTNFIGLTR